MKFGPEPPRMTLGDPWRGIWTTKAQEDKMILAGMIKTTADPKKRQVTISIPKGSATLSFSQTIKLVQSLINMLEKADELSTD